MTTGGLSSSATTCDRAHSPGVAMRSDSPLDGAIQVARPDRRSSGSEPIGGDRASGPGAPGLRRFRVRPPTSVSPGSAPEPSPGTIRGDPAGGSAAGCARWRGHGDGILQVHVLGEAHEDLVTVAQGGKELIALDLDERWADRVRLRSVHMGPVD
jgi:hypothetical protein